MDLKTFVSETITQISEGIIEAQENNPRASINPKISIIQNGICTVASLDHTEYAHLLNFDISVTVQDKANVDGKGQIKVFSMSFCFP